MFDGLSKDDITSALNELIDIFGVKEDSSADSLVALLRKKNTEACVQEIAARLGLPISVSLSYVSAKFTLGNTDGFRSSSLARTDRRGRGVGGITAQVSIPQHMPMFGTSGLRGYPIQVRVSENCHSHPHTFVSIMAHELSHVLLAAMWSPYKDSELHTDLIPILLGFREVARRGRKTVESTTSGSTTTTSTRTFGYLNDSQFEFACSYVSRILRQHRHGKKHLTEILQQGERRLTKATRALAAFRDYLSFVDRQVPGKMRAEHAQRIVQLHARDYSQEWKNHIASAKARLDAAASFVRRLHHYTSSAVEQLRAHTGAVEGASYDLREVTEEVVKDERILGRYVGAIYRLRRLFAITFGRMKASSQEDGAANASQPTHSETNSTSSAAGS